jgi:integrase
MVDVVVEHPNGSIERVRKVSPVQTVRGAEKYERELRQALLDGARRKEATPPRAAPTFGAFAETFLDTYATTNNRPATVREKRRTVRRALAPHFERTRLDQIGPREIEAFKATRKAAGLAAKTINEEIGLLAKILRTAHEWGEIDKLPVIKRLKQPPATFDFLDFEEAERLLAAAEKEADPWHAMIPVACLTGLRVGELRALGWDDVDLVARRIHVRQAADDRGELHPPKNGRPRIVDLPQRAVEVLRKHKHLRGAFVFCREDGSMLKRWHCESRRRRGETGPLSRVCKRAGLRQVGWHVLRHSYCSHLVMRGANLVEVKELAGHSSLTMTMRYAHLSPASRRAAAGLLDQRGDGTMAAPVAVPSEDRNASGR